VLPILNNLLENREMNLEDGRFLVHPKRYDSLLRAHSQSTIDEWKLVRVHEDFRVIALGLPVPKYVGNPLDPPLRSRFQARDVKSPNYNAQLAHLQMVSKAPEVALQKLLSVATVLRTVEMEQTVALPEFPAQLDAIAGILACFPEVSLRFLLDLAYPFPLMPTCDPEQRKLIESLYQRFDLLEDSTTNFTRTGYTLLSLEKPGGNNLPTVNGVPLYPIQAAFAVEGQQEPTTVIKLRAGPRPSGSAEFFIETEYHRSVLTAMLLSHSSSDFCLVGNKGVGKSALVRNFARSTGYVVEYVPMFKDMTPRDLLQRRSTLLNGDTTWDDSNLVVAALEGRLAILDGIDQLSIGTLSTIQRLLQDRDITLPDGTRLVRHDRYAAIEKDLAKRGRVVESNLKAIHPNFRVIALARPSSFGPLGASKATSWLFPEVLAMFQFHYIRPLSGREEGEVLRALAPGVQEAKLTQLLDFAARLRGDMDDIVQALSNSLSTRQLIRICRRINLYPKESVHSAIHKVCLSRFLPVLAQNTLNTLLAKSNILPEADPVDETTLKMEIVTTPAGGKALRIGDILEVIRPPSNPLLVPEIVFHDNPRQTKIMMEMLKDYQLGENLLLIGNQGVGKNKLADRFLELLRLPREYIQLHRDTTVQTLTSQPTVNHGILVYEDSPLVRAVREGYVLVVDEADKAPTHVTAVLKTLVEDGEMLLSDGRRIVSSSFDTPENLARSPKTIVIHEHFRMVVLANRPGFPFLGNDFYREIGDVFSSHAVDNPDADSEMYLLRKYGPDVPEETLLKLTAAFSDLRKLVEDGLISYPYSTRELVNIVRHMQLYPSEGISKILQNVFDFDQYEREAKDLLIQTLQKHGIPVGLESDFAVSLGVRPPEKNILPLWQFVLKMPPPLID